MKTLKIEGVISRKQDADKLAKGEKYFSLEDLESFLAMNGDEPFEVEIDSPGGSVEEGFRIYNALKGLGVTTTAITANSIASVIFLAGTVRKVMPNSEIIIHNAWVEADAFSGEKLNFHTLNALTELFAETDMKILAVYTHVTGHANASTLLAYMAEDKNIGGQMAVDLGFATELVDSQTKINAFKNKVLTFSQNQIELINNNQQENEMKTEEKLNAFEKVLGTLKNLFKVQMKNMAVSTQDGVALFIAGAEDGELVGKTVYLAEEGLPTEALAPEGVHILADGTSITVGADGVISEAVAPVAAADPLEEMDALKAALAAMEEEKTKAYEDKEKLENKVKAMQANENAQKKALNDLALEFAQLKNQILGDPDANKKAPVFTSEEYSKLPVSEKIRLRAMAKA
jgi:ATP-dependent protease ClpP protease subunit